MLNANYTFDNFFAKYTSRGIKIAKTIAQNPGREYNPLLICGDIGSGKTHLLQAIGNESIKNGNKVIYTTAESFTNEFLKSIMAGDNNRKKFKEKYIKTDVLLIDDLQFLHKKYGTQTELNYIFDFLNNNRVQMVFTSDKALSRIGNGLTITIPSLDFNSRYFIIKNLLALNKITLRTKDIKNIAKNSHNDVRYIISAITKIKAKNGCWQNVYQYMIDQIY
jgi:chromosomal replication initiator protein